LSALHGDDHRSLRISPVHACGPASLEREPCVQQGDCVLLGARLANTCLNPASTHPANRNSPGIATERRATWECWGKQLQKPMCRPTPGLHFQHTVCRTHRAANRDEIG
jgi:hypothetical protein